MDKSLKDRLLKELTAEHHTDNECALLEAYIIQTLKGNMIPAAQFMNGKDSEPNLPSLLLDAIEEWIELTQPNLFYLSLTMFFQQARAEKTDVLVNRMGILLDVTNERLQAVYESVKPIHRTN
ncbi:hypothetical protein ACFPMF_15320 [Larkinella bovis]|uniref:TerB family tellurite resistance protein n=1 Tax=Larkinella bovis TaxID=683041 RepID=A0ABW0IH61_9BACT